MNHLMYVIFVGLLVITAIMLMLGLFYIFMKKKEHRRITEQRIKYIEKMDSLDNEERALLRNLAERTHIIYYSYEIHTMIYMVCSMFGLLYTITSFVLSLFGEIGIFAVIVSFLSVFFVIIIIYVKPQRRSTQFLLGWRRLTHGLLMLLYGNSDSTALNERIIAKQPIQSKKDYILRLLEEVENSFVADEDNN